MRDATDLEGRFTDVADAAGAVRLDEQRRRPRVADAAAAVGDG